MSQYHSPYSSPAQHQTPQQPNYGYDFSYYQPGDNPLAPARRAGVMMFIVGGLLAIGGLCCGAMGALAPLDEIIGQHPILNSTPGMTVELLQIGIIVLGVLGLLFGVVLLVLGYFVRGGGMVPIVISGVVIGLAVLFNVLNIISTAVQLRGAEMIAGLCMNVIPLVLMVVLLITLVQAAKAAPRVTMMKSQYQQQLWQYQQQQQMYQAGYLAPPPQQQAEYGQPASPPPPPPASASPDDPSRGDPYGPAT